MNFFLSTDWELVRGLRNSPRKKDARNLMPEFEDTEDEIIARVGETVKIPCSVKNLGENVVSDSFCPNNFL